MEAKISLSLSHSLHPPLCAFTCLSVRSLSVCLAHSALQTKRKCVSPKMAVGTKGSAIRTHQQQTDRQRRDRRTEGKRREEEGEKVSWPQLAARVAPVKPVSWSIHQPWQISLAWASFVTWIVGVGDGGADGVGLQGEGWRRRHSWTQIWKPKRINTINNRYFRHQMIQTDFWIFLCFSFIVLVLNVLYYCPFII